jgi:signal transduction histidine kinase
MLVLGYGSGRMRKLRLLNVEDSEDDSLFLCRHLGRAGYDLQWERVETLAGLEQALQRQMWDVIISDYVMPNFSAPAALSALKQRGLDIPFIIISGAIGEQTAVAAMRAGAHDYLMKDNLARLAPAIEREIQDCRVRRERRRAEEALRASEKLVTLGRLAATIAHEVNNPLEAVTNVLYLLGRRDLDATSREYVKLAEQELMRVTQIVRQSLAFSRITTDQAPISISRLLDEVLMLYAPRIKAHGVRVEKRFEYDAPVPGELRQVFSNLIVNAVDAVERGGLVRLHVASRSNWRNLRRKGLLLVVADNGTGISPEHREEIFQPFFSTKRDKGNGLGLWISSEIVQKHGGSIRVRSSVSPGRNGTVFSLFIPLQAERTERNAAQAGAAS